MNYQLLGRSGLRVSDLCLGTMTFGEDWGWGAAKDEARKIYDAYREAGGNFIDTANIYTNGTSEKLVGEFIAGHREEVVVATKYTNAPSALTASPAPMRMPAATSARTWCRPSRPASSASARTTSISTGCTSGTRSRPVEEVMRAFDDLVRAGKVLYVGISDAPAWVVAKANTLAELRGWTRFVGLADRVQPDRAHRRARAHPDGEGPADDGAGLVAPAQWLA